MLPVKCSFIWQNGFRYETITPIKKEICSLHRNTSCHNRFKEKNTMDENRNCIIYTLKICGNSEFDSLFHGKVP